MNIKLLLINFLYTLKGFQLNNLFGIIKFPGTFIVLKRASNTILILTLFLSISTYGQQQVETFTTPGTTTWTVPEGVNEITVEVWGGGGAGGAGLNRNNPGNIPGGGGGGGGFTTQTLTVVPETTYNITVGAGGAGVVGGNGGNGGSSSADFGGILVSANGGTGGTAGTNSGNLAVSGTGSSGGTGGTYNGGAGSNGSFSTYGGGGGGSSAGTAANGNNATNATGATAPAGGGNGGDGRTTTSGAGFGSPGVTPGGGGGGGLGGPGNNASYAGGAGANGQVRITYADPCDAIASGNPDIDNDGVSDICDLDNDNDGILDADEELFGFIEYEFYDQSPAGNTVDNIPTTSPDFSGIVSNFDVTTLSTSLTGSIDEFSIRYKGIIEIDSDDTFTFYTSSDDGSKLSINGIPVVNNDDIHGVQEESGTIALTAGKHDIEILYFENVGGQSLSISYESSSISKTTVPFSVLSFAPDTDAIPNALDLDSDNDGIYDALEAGANPADIGPDGRLIGGVDANGVPLVANGGFTTLIDTDNDGVPNFLDLDSDEDGCSDANEYYQEINADGNRYIVDDLSYGDSDTITINANGLVEQAGYDGTNYSDVLDNSISETCNECNPLTSGNTDTDGDGVSDICDLDSDNDGILDVDEKTSNVLSYEFYDFAPVGNTVDNIPPTNPDFTGVISNFDVTALSNNLTGNTNEFSIRYKGFIEINTAGIYTFYTNSDDGSKLFINGIEVVDNDGQHAVRERFGEINLVAGTHTIEILYFEGTSSQELSVSYKSRSISKTNIPFSILSSGKDTDKDGVPDYIDLDSDNDGIYDALEAGANSTGIDSNGRLTGGVDSDGVPIDASGGFTLIDTDSDGIANPYDLDSDGDGCSDANEYYRDINADGSFYQSDDLAFGNSATITINANGLVEQASYDGSNYNDTLDDMISEACNECDPLVSGNLDTDGDGVSDICDLDDDNDGILDVDENVGATKAIFETTPQAYWIFNGNLNDSSGNNYNPGTGTVSPTFSTDAVEGSNSALFNGSNQEIRYSRDGSFMESASNQISFSAWIKPNNLTGNRIIYEEGGATNGAALWLNNGLLTYTTRRGGAGSQINVSASTTLTVDNNWHHVAATFYNGTLTVYLDGVSNSTTAPYTTIPNHGDNGGIGGQIGNETSIGLAASNYSGLIDAARYDNTTAWTNTRIRKEAFLVLDTDNDGIINQLDLDSDNDGCSDANEYYQDIEADGNRAGDDDLAYGRASAITISANGLVDQASYSGSNYSDAIDNSIAEACNECNASASGTTDTDGDGVADVCDLDDDNDGILDINEQTPNFVTSPQAIWNFENSLDDSENTNNPTATGNEPTFSRDAIEGCYSASFDGSQKIKYGVNNGFMTQSTPQISFSAWIKPDDLTGNKIIYEEGGSSNGVALWLNDNILTFTTLNSSRIDVVASTTLTENMWHHVAATFDSGELKVYLDGVSEKTTALYTSIANHNDGGGNSGIGGEFNTTAIGGGETNFSGLMDAVRYSNSTAWSDTDIIDESTLIDIDSDGDGIVDRLDLDSDNDGIPDITEAGGVDADNDGRVDNNTDTNIDGWADVFDPNGGGTPLSDPDTDLDCFKNRIDLDSDNDGILDIVEAGGVDTDDNGRVDDNTDTDSDGYADTFDSDNSGTALPDTDTDSDGLPNRISLDSDADDCPDALEGDYGFSPSDLDIDNSLSGGVNTNGIPTITGTPQNAGTAYDDTQQSITCDPCNVASGNPDSDGDGVTNFCDLDDDNDGILDADEIANNCTFTFETGVDAYWPLDGDTGDASGNGNDENGSVAVTYSTDAIQGSNSIDFGSTDPIRYSIDGGFMKSAYTNISFSAWIKPSDLTGNQIIYEEGGITNGAALWLNGNTLTFSTRNAGTQLNVTYPDPLVPNQWQHVVAIFQNGELMVYLNGVASSPVVAGYVEIPGHGNDGGIGGEVGGENSAGISGNFTGLMDAVRYSHSESWTIVDVRKEINSCDTDGDGTANSLDLDSDNDGIADIIEAGGVDTDNNGMVDDNTDSDNDGWADTFDSDDGGTALPDEDTDADGIPNRLDLDSDNDGITDIIEAGGVDTDNNGMVDDTTDSDNDGWANTFDSDNGGTALPDTDTDSDGLPNRISLDSDADDCPDALEGDYGFSPSDLDIDNSLSSGVNTNGIPTITGAPQNAGTAYDDTLQADACDPCNIASENPDTDGDGVTNFCDLDDDNDGILDVDEGESMPAEAYWTFDNSTDDVSGNSQNEINSQTVTYSNDAVQGSASIDFSTTNPIQYNDGSFLNTASSTFSYAAWIKADDLSGNRIIFDEGGAGSGLTLWIDNGTLSFTTIAVGFGQFNVTHQTPLTVDGLWHHVAGVFDNGSLTVYLDGIPSIPIPPASYTSIPNHGNQGGVGGVISNTALGADTSDDFNFDGKIDAVKYHNSIAWSDAEILNDAVLLEKDTDGDGIIDRLDLDSDNDGIADIIEVGGVDTDNNGMVDDPTDSDNDGWADTFDSDNGGTALPDTDTDADGIPNRIDLDSDNDGITDIIEAGGVDTDNNGIVDDTTDSDNDGWANTFDSDDGGTALPDTNSDADGIPNRLDLDSDNDGCSDANEYYRDINADGNRYAVDDLAYGDSDTITINANGLVGEASYDGAYYSDAIDNSVSETCNECKPTISGNPDTDADGVSDICDLDDDNDGILDVDEKTNNVLGYEFYDAAPVPNTVDNIPTTNPDFTGVISDFDVKALSSSLISRNNDFSIRYKGFIEINSTDTYTFYTRSDDGSKLFINGFEVVDNDGQHPAEEEFGEIKLIAGTHVIEILYFEVSQSEELSVSYKSSSVSKTNIPFSILSYRDTDSDGIANRQDLDSDDDGCSDANEYYALANADGGDDSVYGLGTPAVDADGLVISAGYDGTNYSDALDPNSNEGCFYIQTVEGNWNTDTNWREQAVPVLSNDAIIRANSTVIQNQAVTNLIIDPTYVVSINNNQTLNIKENLTNNGDVDGDGYVVFDGTTSQQIIGDGTDAGSFTNIRLNNSAGLTLSDDADLISVLDLDAGSFTVDTGKFLTFKSGATQTAVLSEVTSTDPNPISGCVIIERYIPASNRSFRYLVSSVNTTALCGKESINANLQEGFNVTDFTNYTGSEIPGFGTHITGSTIGDMGFDATQTGNPSMFEWNAASQLWNAIPNTETKPLNIGESYSLLIRGGRELDLNVSNTNTGSNPTTLRFTGELQTGDVIVNNLAVNDEEYNLIANPYQAQVDMKTLLSDNSTNLSKNFMYIYDPTIGTQGGYAVIDLDTEVTDPVSSDADKFLQPNQAAFIQNVGPSPSLSFSETYKKATDQSLTTDTFRNSKTSNSDGSISISLKRNHNSNWIVTDGIRLYFKDIFDNAILNNDALKFWNLDESLAILNEQTYLSIERRKYPNPDESVELFIYNLKNFEYQLFLTTENLEKTAYLKDNYTGTLQEIENNTVTLYPFSASGQNPESVSNERFELQFEDTTLGVNEMNSESISIYPNPASEIVNIQIPKSINGNANIEFMDITGKLLSTESAKVENGSISTQKIRNFASGVYLVKIEIDDKEFIKKIIVN